MKESVKIKKVTLKDVAAAAELAVPTVSQILNGRRNFCSAEQATRVRNLAQEMGYMPNIGYKIMTGQQTRTVGLIFSQTRTYHDEHVMKLAMNLITRLEKQGESVYATIMEDDAAKNLQSVRELVNRGCSAFIFLGSPIGCEDILPELDGRGINYVSENNDCSKRDISLDIPYVYEQYIRHLLAQGVTKFVCIMAEPFFASNCRPELSILHEKGVLKAPGHYFHRIAPIEGVDFDCSDLYFEQGYQATKKLLAETPELAGFIYPLDYLALGGIKALNEAGRTAGKDAWVYGRNNTRSGRFSLQPLSTADLCIDEHVSWMVEHLHDRMPVIKTLRPQVIYRN